MLDASEIGKYGTLRLMKRHEPDVVVASFPVDDDVVTFGRNPDCSVRLYYAWVSAVHCKIVFEERKAFLQVLGTNGLLVDGCEVFPTKSPTASPTTIPLINGSLIEIHKKRFQFTYPPKELRPYLMATPHTKRRSSLRMSMIQSAQVFSPRPSPHPQENLRVLQSPFKPFTTTGGQADLVRLVDGDHPRVVEEDQDLVILEDMPMDASDRKVEFSEHDAPATPTPRGRQQPMGPLYPPQPKLSTPRRRSAPSLHRAVLLRSAHRAAVMHDTPPQNVDAEPLGKEDEDEIEEEEVEEVVNGDLIENSGHEEGTTEEWVEQSAQEEEGDNTIESHHAEVDDKSYAQESKDRDDERLDEEQNSIVSTPAQKNGVRHLGAFMTPQVRSQLTGPQRPPPGGRFSLGGSQPGQSVQPWKVRDIMAAMNDDRVVKQEDDHMNTPMKVEISEEEKQAIRNRRKSALTMPDLTLTYIPGSRRTSVLPSPPHSPVRRGTKGVDHEGGKPEDEEDTKSLLAKMKETVDGMRRKSLAGRQGQTGFWRAGSATPSPIKREGLGAGFSLLAPSPASAKSSAGKGRSLFELGVSAVMEETSSQVRNAEVEEGVKATQSPGEVQVKFSKGQDSDSDSEGMEVEVNNNRRSFEMAEGREGGEVEVDEFIEDAVLVGEGDEEQERYSTEKDPSDGQIKKRSSVLQPPKTPRMDGLKEMFQLPRANGKTPSFKGVREMFQMPAGSMTETPKYVGIRQMFVEPKSFASPDMSGVEEMFAPPEQSGTLAPDIKTASAADEHAVKVIVSKGVFTAPRTGVRRETARPALGTPTDMSTMADDEATPAEPAQAADSQSKVGKRDVKTNDTVPKGAIVRRGRSKKVTDSDAEVEEAVPTKAKSVAARSKGVAKSTKDKTEEAESEIQENRPRLTEKVTKSVSKKGRIVKTVTPDTSLERQVSSDAQAHKAQKLAWNARATSETTESEADSQPMEAVKPSRRARTKVSDSTPAKLSATTSSRRGTRAKSIDMDSNEDPLESIGRPNSPDLPVTKAAKTTQGVRSKTKIVVETITEEEEQPRRKPKARSTSLETEDIDMGAPTGLVTAKKTTTRKTTATKQKNANIEREPDDKLDKENAQDSTTDGQSSMPAKPSSTKVPRSRTAGKGVKAEVDAALVPRVTRARTRK